MAEVVTGIAGAAIGFVVGGPTGAMYGFQIGYASGSYLFAPNQTIQGPRIGELSAQTSREGVPRPIVFGTARPIGGNIIATTQPIIRIRRDKQKSGKGGGGSTTSETEEVFRTYAIRICEGPVTGVRRVWRNGKLVFFAGSTDPAQIENNQEFLKKATFYLGSYSQMPSPVLQAAFGVNNVVAHRGTCYMVIDDENLTQLGGAIPQYVFEVQRAEGIPLTSTVYPIEDINAIQSSGPTVSQAGWGPTANLREPIDAVGPVVTEADLREVFKSYNAGIESIDADGPVVTAGNLRDPMKTYNVGNEPIDADGPVVTSANLRDALITYENYEPEGVDADGPFVTSGDLT